MNKRRFGMPPSALSRNGSYSIHEWATNPETRGLAKTIDSLMTLAEESGFRLTGRTDEIACLCNACARRGMPMLMYQAGVHSGESDGKDAGYIALRELLDVTTDSTC